MTRLVLKVLGEFTALANNGDPVVVISKKNRALLAVLALAPNGSATRERLCDLLWSDRGPEQARSSLRQALVALRKDLAELVPLPVLADDERVRLDPNMVEVDALVIQALSKSVNLTVAGKIAALCTGELLEGFQVKDPVFQLWLASERQKWRDLSIKALELCCGQLQGQERVDAAKQLVALDPLREASHGALMRAYSDCGERALALLHYQDCRSILMRELGVEPGEGIETIRRNLMGKGQIATPPSVVLPSPVAKQIPTGPAGHISIAVLAFINLSGDPEQRYFSDGFSEDIITELSRFPSLFVIARNTSFQFRDGTGDARAAAREVGAQFIVEGSVRLTTGARVRITVKLIETEHGGQLWGERYDRDLDELFQVQDEVVRTIVATIFGRLEAAEIRRVKRQPTENMVAYDKLLRGIEHLRGFGADDNRRARELFEGAVSLDPDYALAQAYLGLSLLVENRYASAPIHIKKQALDCTLRAVRLQPDESRCHQFLALAYRFGDEYDLALQHFERAVALNPNDANAIASLGSTLAIAGRAEEGHSMIRLAMQLNPRHPAWYWGSLAIAFYALRRYEDALQASRMQGPDKTVWQMARMAACLAWLDRMDEARKQTAEVLLMKPDFRISVDMPHYKHPADAEHLASGLRKAGLPD